MKRRRTARGYIKSDPPPMVIDQPFSLVPEAGTITGTVMDSAGTPWANAVITATFRPSVLNSGGAPFWNNAPLDTNPPSIGANNSGFFSIILPTNATITPVDSQWEIGICPNASISCTIVVITVVVGTTDISAIIQRAMPVPPIGVNAFPLPRTYSNTEVRGNPPLNFGALVANTTNNDIEFWDGTQWVSLGSSTPPQPPQVYPPAGIAVSTGSSWGTSIPSTGGNATLNGLNMALNGTYNSTISFGTGFGAPAINLFGTIGGGGSFGWGLNSSEMQFYISPVAHFSWNNGGDLTTPGTNELMRLSTTGLTLPGNLTVNGTINNVLPLTLTAPTTVAIGTNNLTFAGNVAVTGNLTAGSIAGLPAGSTGYSQYLVNNNGVIGNAPSTGLLQLGSVVYAGQSGGSFVVVGQTTLGVLAAGNTTITGNLDVTGTITQAGNPLVPIIGLAAGTDLNTVTATGFYRATDFTNGPAGVGTSLASIIVNSTPGGVYAVQTLVDMNDSVNIVEYMRKNVAGTWTGWFVFTGVPV